MANRTGKTSSAEIVASIVDLLTEIHLRLPIKSLIRFKQVSKHWHSLISDPAFRIRRNPIPNPAAGIFVRLQNRLLATRNAYVSFSNKKSTRKQTAFQIMQSCNGLLLCCDKKEGNYFVHNPTTNEFSNLEKMSQGVMTLAFDPAKSRHYKVFCERWLLGPHNENMDEFEVYSSETSSWRKIDRALRMRNGVYWNGAIHWIDRKTGNFMYFNPDDVEDRVVELSIPSPMLGGGSNYFGESCGHLSYIEFVRESASVSVYELRKDYSEWFVKYEIDLSPLNVDKIIWWRYTFGSTTLVRGEKDEDSFLVVILSPKVIVRYNFVQGTCETLCDFGDDGDLGDDGDQFEFAMTPAGFQYIESLCFP